LVLSSNLGKIISLITFYRNTICLSFYHKSQPHFCTYCTCWHHW